MSSESHRHVQEGVDGEVGKIRIARFLAMAGVASRRACEELIRKGLVTLNGQVVEQLSCRVSPVGDHVCCQGQHITPESLTYVLLNKPPGYTCSASDCHAKALARELMPSELGRLFSVGRLDRESEGLILFTNDGDFAERLSHPRYGVPKTYRVAFSGAFSKIIAQRMREGVLDEGELLRAEQVTCIRRERGGGVLELVLREGKKREIRRMCRRCLLHIERLVRTSIGGLQDEQLAPGQWRFLADAEVARLRSAGSG